MPPVRRTEQEECAFMEDLLSGLDDSFFTAVPSPDRIPRQCTPARTARPHSSAFTTPTRKGPLGEANGNIFPLGAGPSAKQRSPRKDEVQQLLEGAEVWDWDDMNSDFLTPRKHTSPKRKTLSDLPEKWIAKQCSRCVVKEVRETTSDGYFYKDLLVQESTGSENRRVSLYDDWRNVDIRIGDIINVIGDFALPPSSSTSSPLPTIEITSKSNLLIHHPDLLITATSLSNAPQCRRRPLLANLVRSSLDATPALVWGNVLHEVMQTCLIEGRWDEAWIESQIAKVVNASLGELLRINVGVEQAKREVKARANGLKMFAERYISETPKTDATLSNTRSDGKHTSQLAISKLYDIEEDIWSPTYGLKGKIDASVHAIISETDGVSNPFVKTSPVTITKDWTMPLEIKTGRAVAGLEHRAQTMLYTLLMSERYQTEVPSGLLYYTQSEEVVRVPAARNEVRALIIARNEMAGYIMRRAPQRSQDGRQAEPEGRQQAIEELGMTESFLPPTIDNAHICGKCYSLDTCMLYRKAVENVVDESSEIKDMFELKTAHITESQAAFFKKWEALISLEEQDLVRFRKELWTMGAAEREDRGRCFSNMRLDVTYTTQDATRKATLKETKIHQYTYRFLKATRGQGSLLNGHMSSGDAITVSIEPDLLALARGFIVELTPQEVVVGVDHELSLDSMLLRRRGMEHEHSPVVFRIDKDELFSGMGRIRGNLAQLFYADGDSRRLQLIVDLMAPRFEAVGDDLVPHHEAVAKDIGRLNANQQLALRKVLSAQDYAIILGMPGTGKTTVVAAIIRALVCMGKSVLLTSYTHSAVDTILLKLKEDADFGILRLGNLDKIHPDVQRFTLSASRKAISLEQLEHQVMTPPVVATTCLTLDHPLFARRQFDYCIVDEASQVTLPTCLGPLRFSDKFVLVGDHFQLPPLVRNRDARKGGLEVSLFRRLSEAHPAAVVDLTEQYRMNEDIMLLSNELIYSNRLRCSSAEVAKRELTLPNRRALGILHEDSSCDRANCWIERLLDENCKAVFVDTDSVPAEDSRVGDLVQNDTEAHLIRQVVESLVRSGVREEQIGVISLYRQQIKLLAYLLQDRRGIEILTADRSQGRDKDCIIMSMVRSNDLGQIGELVKDWRRMNVSFTRARSKLIIFGSRKTLRAAPLLEQFFQLMESRDWIMRLPPNADQMHEHLQKTCHKRPLDEATDLNPNNIIGDRAQKRVKGGRVAEEGLLRGRPILKDLLNGTK